MFLYIIFFFFSIQKLLKVVFAKSNSDITKYALKLINLIPNQSHATSCIYGIKTMFDEESYPVDTNNLYTIDVIIIFSIIYIWYTKYNFYILIFLI